MPQLGSNRKKGTGSIRERSAGHYELRYYDKATKRQAVRTFVAPRAERGASIRAARAALASLVADAECGRYVYARDANPEPALDSEPQPGARTVGDVLDDWLAHCESVGRAHTTRNGYRIRAERFKAAIGSVALSALGSRDVDQLYAHWRAEGMTQAGVVHHHRVLRAALNQAKKWEWVDRNVALNATVTMPAPPELHVPSLQQTEALVLRAEQGASPDLGSIVLFAIMTGCRRGELCGLQWGDIDWARQRLTFRRSVWEVRSETGIKDTKTHRVRTIALDPACMRLLAARRQRADTDANMAGVAADEGSYVWATSVDGLAPRTPDSITRAFAHLCDTLERETGQPWPFRFHDLRHLSATELIAGGMDVRTVAGRLGHADPTVTLRVYAHAAQERDRAAAELLGTRFALPTASPK
jgi:integrase